MWTIAGVATPLTILTTAHPLSDARLHRISAALARSGTEHVIVGPGDRRDAPPTAQAVRILRRRRPGGRLRDALVEPVRCRGPLMLIDPDPIIPAGVLAALGRSRPLIVDLHEDYLAVAADRRWARGRRAVLVRGVVRLVHALAARATLTVVADEHVPPLVAKRRLVVRNLPEAHWVRAPTARAATPTAVYIGDIRPSRGLHTMLGAIAAATRWELDLVGGLSEIDRPALDSLVREHGLQARVRYHGRLPLDAAWSVAEGAWVGLALLADTPAYRAALPTKVYEYLARGLPVLATPLPRLADFLEASAAGRTASTAQDAAAILEAWRHDQAELDRLSSSARAWALEHLTTSSSPFDVLAVTIASIISRTEPFDDHPRPTER